MERLSALEILSSNGLAREAYAYLGVLAIETYPNSFSGLPWNGLVEGVLDRLIQRRPDGYATLDWAMTNGPITNVVAVIGYSSGAATVGSWYGDHQRADSPFYLIEAAGVWVAPPGFEPQFAGDPFLYDARQIVETWRQDYNTVRPHQSLGDRTPEEFRAAAAARPGRGTRPAIFSQ